MVYEYCQWGDLQNSLNKKEGKRMQQQDANRVLLDLYRALDYLYGLNIIHRNVQPNTIWMSIEGQAKLSGLECAVVGDPKSGMAEGSKLQHNGYNPPEAQLGKAGDLQDIWHLGVIFYYCLYGVLPFLKDPDSSDYKENKTKGKIDTRIESVKIDEESKYIIKKALQPDLDKRLTWQELSETDIVKDEGDGFMDFGDQSEEGENQSQPGDSDNPAGLDKEPKGIEFGGEGSGLRFCALGITGWRPQMEDSHICWSHFEKDHHIFGVFDGHGGIEVAYFLRDKYLSELSNL